MKYVEDRVTHIVNNDHCGSDRHYDAALAFDDDGILKALRIDCVDDYGAYLQFGTGTHGNGLSQIVGPYGSIKHVEYSLAAVLTNKNQQGAYRGFGAEVSNWMLERLVDLAARDLGMDRVEIRRRNLLDARPVPVPHADRQHLRQRQLPGRPGEDPRGGRLRPLGRLPRRRRAPRAATSASASSPRRSAASSARPSSGSGSTSRSSRRPSSPESASLQIDPTGQIVVTLHSQSLWGNSPETVVSQVVAEEFDVDPNDVVVTYADSQHALPGTGPGRVALHRHGLGRGRRRGGGSSRRRSCASPPTSSRWRRSTSSSATAASA